MCFSVSLLVFFFSLINYAEVTGSNPVSQMKLCFSHTHFFKLHTLANVATWKLIEKKNKQLFLTAS